MARRIDASYINMMIGRPCKPDDDLKGLWRMLLGTPFPACGMAEEAEVESSDGDGAERRENPGVKLDAKTAATGE